MDRTGRVDYIYGSRESHESLELHESCELHELVSHTDQEVMWIDGLPHKFNIIQIKMTPVVCWILKINLS